MTSMNKPLRRPDRACAGVGDLRVFAANWLVVPLDVAIERAQRAALRRAIDRCRRAQREWLDSEIRLREAVIERSAETAAKNVELGRVVIGCEAHVERLRKRLADLSIEIARYWDPLKHPRWPQGDPRSWGGRFRDRDGGGVVPVGGKVPTTSPPPVRPTPGNPTTGLPPANPTGKPPTRGAEQRPPRRDNEPIPPLPPRRNRPRDWPEPGDPPHDLPIEEAADKLQRDLAGGAYRQDADGNLYVDETMTRLAISATVKKGIETGHEWIFIFERTTGEIMTPRTDHSETSVYLGPEFDKTTILEPDKEWEVHHNHPLDFSLSDADLRILAYNPNVKRIVAHSHDGSHFSATILPLPPSTLSSVAFEIGEGYGRARDYAFEEIGPTGFSRLETGEIERIRSHITNLILAKAKIIDYAYYLSPDMKRIIEKGGGAKVLDRIVARAARRMDLKALIVFGGEHQMTKQTEPAWPAVGEGLTEGIFDGPTCCAPREDWAEWLEWLRTIPRPGRTVHAAIRSAERMLADFDSGKWPPPAWREKYEAGWAERRRTGRRM